MIRKSITPIWRKTFIFLCLFAGSPVCQTMLANGLPVSAVDQQLAVRGIVADKNGEPLIGVTVSVVGQTGGTVTDIDGNYTIAAKVGTKL